MPSRRAYLAALAAAGTAGCIGGSAGSTTGAPTDHGSAGSRTASRPAVTVEAAAVQYAYRHIENVDWNGIRSADGQFVFVTVDATDAEQPPNRDAFRLVTADDVYEPADIRDTAPVGLDVPGGPYTPEQENEEPTGWLAFSVPARLDTEPSLRLDAENNSWKRRLDTEKATAPPPAWDWTASAPETVRPGERFTITVTADNVGDGPGTFRGAVNFSFPLYRPEGFDIVLDSGESGEATISASSTHADPGMELEYGVRTPAGESTVTVAVGAESATTGSPN